MIKPILFLFILLSGLSFAYGQGCPNDDFSLLNFDYWEAFTGIHTGGGSGCCPVPGVVPDRHSIITQTMVDTNTCGGLTVPPPGFPQCAKLGNANDGSQADRLIYHFTVDPANPAFIFRYALVFELWIYDKPQAPYFSYKIFNANHEIVDNVCGFKEIFADSQDPNFHQCYGNFHIAAWKDWTTEGIDLTAFIGQQLSIEFTACDATDGTSFGYAYILAECASMNIDLSYCPGEDSVVLTAPSGFSYQWNTGDTTQSITIQNPALGTTYTCNVSSSMSCGFLLHTIILYTVMNPSFVHHHDTCSRRVYFTGTSSISTGNAFSSHWDFGDGTFSNLVNPEHVYPGPGNYNVTLTIATIGGCDSSVTQTVNIGNVPLAIFTAHDTCVNFPVLFHNYSYAQDSIVSWMWKFGDNSPINTTDWEPSHVYTVPGKYTIKLIVTNARGCMDTISRSVKIYGIPVADFSVSSPLCSGKNTTIIFTGSATPVSTYNWNFNGGTVISGTGAGPYVVSWSTSGTYQVTLDLIDPLCNSFSTKTKSLIINPGPVANAGSDTTICLGHSVMLTATGGTDYTWAPAASLNNSHIANPTATPTVTTNYIVTVSLTSCTSVDTVKVTVEELSPVTVTPDTLVCNKLYLSATGGAFYQWSPPTFLSATNIPNPFCSPSATTIYTVTITDSAGCKAIRHVTVAVAGAINSSFNLTKDSVCPGQTAIIYFNGGTINPYATYTWDFDGGIISYGSGMGPYSVYWLTNGIRHVSLTVTEYTCDTSITVKTIKVKNGPNADAGPNDSICEGQSAQLSASGGLVYSWYPISSLSNSLIPNPIATPLITTTYGLYVYQAGCIGQDSVTIVVWPLPTASLSPDTTICKGDTIELHVGGGISYQWSPPLGLSSTSVQNPLAYPTTTTTYTVSVSDEHGCSSSDSLIITVNDRPTSSFTVDDSLICLGSNVAVTYTGTGTPSSNYTWDFNGATILSGSGQGPYVITWPAPGNYVLTLLVDESNCYSPMTSAGVKVFKVEAAISNHQDIQCFGDTNGMAVVTASGGTPPYNYQWNTSQTTDTIDELIAGTYIVTVTDDNGCTGSDTVTITAPAAPLAVNPTWENISCQYLCDGWITSSVSGGTSPYAYTWNTSPPLQDTALFDLCPGNYAITVTDDHGCVAAEIFNLVINTTVEASFTTDVTSGFVPLSVNFTFTGLGANSLQWDFGDNNTSDQQNPTHIYETPGTFEVLLIINSLDPDFCSDTTKITIQVEDTSYIVIPNVFTPNSDNYNDYFTVNSHYVENCTITVFNRWGTVVYGSDNEDIRWDGKNKDGSACPEGTYFYTLEAKGKDGKAYKEKGVITLLK